MFAIVSVLYCPQAARTANLRLSVYSTAQNYFPEATLMSENVPKFLCLAFRIDGK